MFRSSCTDQTIQLKGKSSNRWIGRSKEENRYSLKSNLNEDETLLLLMEILDEVEEFFLRDFFADIFSDKMKYKISLKGKLNFCGNANRRE